MAIGIIVHGGAGRFLEHEYDEALTAVRAAVAAGRDVLVNGGSALDAAEAATRVMEDAPILNAGTGATINQDGEIELDAMIQGGETQKFGAVAGVKRIKNPVSVARLIMERTIHHFLITDGAEAFAESQGISLIDNKSLLTERQLLGQHDAEDTVGVVTLDAQGRMACAVSTGGIRNKLPGRVGDSPIAGAGGYVDSRLGGASATGVGEGIMRSLLTFRAVELLATRDIQRAADESIRLFGERFDGLGGIIMLDRNGKPAYSHNTEHMPCAWLDDDDIRARITDG